MLFCELDGRVLGGMQFGGAGGGARSLGGWWMLFARNGSWLVYRHDVPNHVMMQLGSLRCCVMVCGCSGAVMLSTSG